MLDAPELADVLGFPEEAGVVDDAVGKFRVISEEQRFHVPVIESAVEELSLLGGEWKNDGQGGAGFLHHPFCPPVGVVHSREMIGSQDRDERAAEFVSLETDIVHRYSSPVLAVQCPIDDESKAKHDGIEGGAYQVLVRVKQVSGGVAGEQCGELSSGEFVLVQNRDARSGV